MLGHPRLACFALICAAALGAAATAGATTAHGCPPRHVTVAGHAAIAYCGPATATITTGGRTYHFRHGTCTQSATVDALQISLGTLVRGASRNGGRSFLGLLIAQSPSESEALEGDLSGHQLLGDSVIAQNSSLLSHGTFVSVLGSSFSGSWNCHGPVVSGR
ncbi:MAG TPA: hypothetical protein VHX66_01925 [Solirubrobacteraceae bacterium]|nr:hypothetical protein [Solirubrobacteraceae bacterium]